MTKIANDARPPGLRLGPGLELLALPTPGLRVTDRTYSDLDRGHWTPPAVEDVELARATLEQLPWLNKHGLFSGVRHWREYQSWCFPNDAEAKARVLAWDDDMARRCHREDQRRFFDADGYGAGGWQLALAWLDAMLPYRNARLYWHGAYMLKHRAERLTWPFYVSSGDMTLAAAMRGYEVRASDSLNADVRLPYTSKRCYDNQAAKDAAAARGERFTA